MRRIFPPIGQGNFAVERFYDGSSMINVVFDCGTSTKDVLKDRINRTILSHQIEKVFISHLDDDHVNGLEYLLKNYDVKQIYLPYLTKEQRILTWLFDYLPLEAGRAPSAFTTQLLRDPAAAVREFGGSSTTDVIFVRPYGNDEFRIDYERSSNSNWYSDFDWNHDFEPQKRFRIESGESVAISSPQYMGPKWFFIPFNFQNADRANRFMAKLREYNINPSDLSKIIKEPDYWKSNYMNLKAIYNSIPGGINTNSMVVYSGTKDDIKHHLIGIDKNQRCTCNRVCRSHLAEGCLYTGDYDASGAQKWKQLQNAFQSVWKHIGTVTVPHHGSRYNYQSELSKMPVHLVINADSQNRYGHPSGSVLRDLIKNDAYFSWVTEDKKSGLEYEIILDID